MYGVVMTATYQKLHLVCKDNTKVEVVERLWMWMTFFTPLEIVD